MNISNPLNPGPTNRTQSTDSEFVDNQDSEFSIPPLEQGTMEVTQSISSSRNIEQTKKAIKALNFFAGAVLGGMTAMTTIGVMATPVGWGIAGAALAIGMTASTVYGGGSEGFKSAIGDAFSGFAIGFGAVSINLATGKVVLLGVGNAAPAFGQFLLGAMYLVLGVKIQADLYNKE